MKVYGENALPITKQKLTERGNEILSVNKVKDSRGEFIWNVKYQPKLQGVGGAKKTLPQITQSQKAVQANIQQPQVPDVVSGSSKPIIP